MLVLTVEDIQRKAGTPFTKYSSQEVDKLVTTLPELFSRNAFGPIFKSADKGPAGEGQADTGGEPFPKKSTGSYLEMRLDDYNEASNRLPSGKVGYLEGGIRSALESPFMDEGLREAGPTQKKAKIVNGIGQQVKPEVGEYGQSGEEEEGAELQVAYGLEDQMRHPNRYYPEHGGHLEYDGEYMMGGEGHYDIAGQYPVYYHAYPHDVHHGHIGNAMPHAAYMQPHQQYYYQPHAQPMMAHPNYPPKRLVQSSPQFLPGQQKKKGEPQPKVAPEKEIREDLEQHENGGVEYLESGHIEEGAQEGYYPYSHDMIHGHPSHMYYAPQQPSYQYDYVDEMGNPIMIYPQTYPQYPPQYPADPHDPYGYYVSPHMYDHPIPPAYDVRQQEEWGEAPRQPKGSTGQSRKGQGNLKAQTDRDRNIQPQLPSKQPGPVANPSSAQRKGDSKGQKKGGQAQGTSDNNPQVQGQNIQNGAQQGNITPREHTRQAQDGQPKQKSGQLARPNVYEDPNMGSQPQLQGQTPNQNPNLSSGGQNSKKPKNGQGQVEGPQAGNSTPSNDRNKRQQPGTQGGQRAPTANQNPNFQGGMQPRQPMNPQNAPFPMMATTMQSPGQKQKPRNKQQPQPEEQFELEEGFYEEDRRGETGQTAGSAKRQQVFYIKK